MPMFAQDADRRQAVPRRYLMCPPQYFDVVYSINPWMHPSTPVDADLAMSQWATVRDLYLDLGHHVDLIEPIPGQPDMVFAANGGLVIDGRALGAKFVHAQRRGEEEPYLRRVREIVAQAEAPERFNEGEGDFLLVGDLILAGCGFRSDPLAGQEVQEYFGHPVITLHLVDPRYYHLDTALAVLGDSQIAYYPAAFTAGSQRTLQTLFPDAIVATAADAAVFGLNAVSDGLNVVVAAEAGHLIDELADRGFKAWPVEMSELRKAGGGAKCCTLEIRS